jgi:hypothetical protein
LAGNLVDAGEGIFEEIEIEARHKAISREARRQGGEYSGVPVVPAILLSANSVDESSQSQASRL